jgi:uncharacterized protein (TIGR02147 family)
MLKLHMDVFFYDNYKTFINDYIESLPKKGRGIKGQLAHALRCQTSYVSQVLNGQADFNLEQCFEVGKFFNLAAEEKEYFLTLCQCNRAGNHELEKYFKEKLTAIQQKRLTLHNRLKNQKKLSNEDSAQYFSSWMYAAVHVLLTIPAFRKVEKLAQMLHLPNEVVLEVLTFLVEKGLALKEQSEFLPGPTSIHLDKTSPFIRQHHTNWRHQAIKSIDRHLDQSLHYSSVISVSEQDAKLIQEKIIKFIAEVKKDIAVSSPEETLRGFNIDFYIPC